MFDIWNQKNELAEKAYCEDNYKSNTITMLTIMNVSFTFPAMVSGSQIQRKYSGEKSFRMIDTSGFIDHIEWEEKTFL